MTFEWSFSVAAGQTISAVAVSFSQPTDFSLSAATVTGTYNVAFTGHNSNSSTTQVPGFTITVSFTHNGTPKSATFSVTGASVAENATHTFTVTPGTNNPTV